MQTRILSVGRELRGRGVETSVLVPEPPSAFSEAALRAGFDVHQTRIVHPRRMKSVVSNVGWLTAFGPSVLAIARLIRHLRPDVVHANGLLNLQPIVAARLAGVPVVWHLIGNVYPTASVRAVVPPIGRVVRQIALVAQAMRGYYLGRSDRLSGRCRVIHEPVDCDYFSPKAVSTGEVDRVRAGLGVAPHETLIGSVGNIGPAKGYEFLVNAAEQVARRASDVRFVVVGPPLDTQRRYYDALRQLTAKLGVDASVIFAGPRSDVREVLAALDVFVMSSVTEGTPIAILEAMAMERPVVASRAGGIPDQVVDGKTGLLVPPRDASALAHAVVSLVQDRARRLQLGAAAREWVREEFSLEGCVQGHVDMYEAALGAART